MATKCQSHLERRRALALLREGRRQRGASSFRIDGGSARQPGIGLRSRRPDPGELPVPAHAQGVTSLYLNLRKVSIYGGSNEIQKNIISQMILGL